MIDFEDLTPFDAGIIFAALVMALGTFCPIVTLPVVGSVNYVMSGNGDGIFIAIGALGVVALVLTGYRRATGIVAGAGMIWMLITLAKIVSLLAEARAKLDHSMKGNPFGGLAKVMANSVGLGWGWVLLFGGAIAIIVLSFAAQQTRAVDKRPAKSERDTADEGISRADALIAEYVAGLSAQSERPASSTAHPASFGKRLR
ncbi:hypothetical protein IVB18_24525 [Bradyrhizobium sp. 186]|uniref:hypothetical protein n=1 Tax=Bradyrhizobium sp. 186 TaxID=2782654 RepID=UPI002000BEA3|nr:hypothetical protein [Bradyrhizobium sp. 186]UPK40114.1 hypothetical protein IVB18_24525 [Bradyrhizobium sp. 186]